MNVVQQKSLQEVNSSIKIPRGVSNLRKFLAFAGPGYMVSVGYMDPGNWATDLAGGSKFGFALLWVILASNLMAQLLQTLALRLGLATGYDLAQACRAYYKRPAAIALWLLCEVAIIACDLAEVIGSAIALSLLFGIPLVAGVLITSADVLILMALMRYGFRVLEAIVITLVATIGVCFAIEMFLAKPDMVGVAKGMFIPSMPEGALLVSLGILGATVMPHNLYLHSSIVQTRDVEKDATSKKFAIRNATMDTVIALSLAFFVNAAILILSASVFGKDNIVVENMQDAYHLLSPALGGMAATLFAVALLASGQSSTITGTLAGQIVMEGFLNIRIAPWVRRLITRLLAIIPAVILVSSTGGKNTVGLLILSQVILSMQLPFAIFPLVMITADKRKMGAFANPIWMTILGALCCILITGLNIYLLCDPGVLGVKWVLVIGAVGALFSAWVMFFYKPKNAETSQEKTWRG